MKPPARRARIAALVLSIVAVAFTFGFGVFLRKALTQFSPDDPERYGVPMVISLVLLLIALLFRMAASICELVWLERTWSNLPEDLRKVGPVDKVSSLLVVGLSFVPGLAWFWKLGLVVAVADGFEHMRKTIPFGAPVPRRLGMTAVIIAWVPGLNVYVAPFLWEMFATRVDRICGEILDRATCDART